MDKSLNSTPSADRVHISFFGLRNAGKSSLVNAVTNQELSVVSPVAGTTTDPVKKAMEIPGLGPVVITDTPGFDDVGALGEMRVQKTMQVLSKTDIAVFVSEHMGGFTDDEKALLELLKSKNVPCVIAYSKCDLGADNAVDEKNAICVSAKTGKNINELKNMLASFGKKETRGIFDSLISKDDIIVLITPIDESAPKGRLILPQVQSIRDILDKDAVCVVTKEDNYEHVLSVLGDKVKLAVCDSQVFHLVDKLTPENIPLTSFSILMARVKGYLKESYSRAAALDTIKENDIILISEGCTHHRQCKDIGTVKLPALIKKYTGVSPVFEFTQGGEFPVDLSRYKLCIHCGGCMLNERELQSRMLQSKEGGLPFLNYGIAIAYMNGIIKRSTAIFEELADG